MYAGLDWTSITINYLCFMSSEAIQTSSFSSKLVFRNSRALATIFGLSQLYTASRGRAAMTIPYEEYARESETDDREIGSKNRKRY